MKRKEERTMNIYEIYVNNAVIQSEGLDEYVALKRLGLFENIHMLDGVRTLDMPDTRNAAWIYQVELNSKPTIVYIKRIG